MYANIHHNKGVIRAANHYDMQVSFQVLPDQEGIVVKYAATGYQEVYAIRNGRPELTYNEVMEEIAWEMSQNKTLLP